MDGAVTWSVLHKPQSAHTQSRVNMIILWAFCILFLVTNSGLKNTIPCLFLNNTLLLLSTFVISGTYVLC